MEFASEPISIRQLAREAVESLRGMSSAKNISVRVTHSEGIDLVRGDARRLKQVLYNFLSNALKFTPAAGVVALRICAEERGCYRLEVEDNGIGIREQDLPKLFTEFGQVCSGFHAREGTGLGLAITKRIVEAQGGRVGVESVFGRGSRFFAVLPMQSPEFPLRGNVVR
jgi:signal transduction histidine kinase